MGLAACHDTSLVPSIWPPPDFELVVEEVAIDAGVPNTVRQLRVLGDGLVIYGCSSRSRRDPESGTALPVFDRLAVYRLVPTCVRALARRLDRLGVTRIDTVQGERGVSLATSLQLTWRAFGEQRRIRAAGRVAGPMAEILAVVQAHMPEGETFGLPGLAERPVTYSLRGVPEPRTDAAAALAAYGELLQADPDDDVLLLQAFALACDLGDRSAADGLLDRWSKATEVVRRAQELFPEGGGLTPAILVAMLPAG
ncbi:MAG: hypothetical protein H6838_13420 [Planctomycetes bacterium]|nr:hypothetical protein [Planctomycetota bacterium]MCB9886490.1 hypothetical protein [Planctomycetota bacterium]